MDMRMETGMDTGIGLVLGADTDVDSGMLMRMGTGIRMSIGACLGIRLGVDPG